MTVEATRSQIFLKNGEFFFPFQKIRGGSIRIFWYPTTLRNLFQKEPLFFIHSNEYGVFKTLPFGERFLKDRGVFGDCFHWIPVDDRPNRKNISLISNKNGYVWTVIKKPLSGAD